MKKVVSKLVFLQKGIGKGNDDRRIVVRLFWRWVSCPDAEDKAVIQCRLISRAETS